MINWNEYICPYCYKKYSYPEGNFRPATCGSFECLQKHLHPELQNRKEVIGTSYRYIKIAHDIHRN